MAEELTEIYPSDGYWVVNIKIEDMDETGKVKKRKEQHLVDAKSVTEAENKTKENMPHSMGDWEIVSVQKSKILVVY